MVKKKWMMSLLPSTVEKLGQNIPVTVVHDYIIWSLTLLVVILRCVIPLTPDSIANTAVNHNVTPHFYSIK